MHLLVVRGRGRFSRRIKCTSVRDETRASWPACLGRTLSARPGDGRAATARRAQTRPTRHATAALATRVVARLLRRVGTRRPSRVSALTFVSRIRKRSRIRRALMSAQTNRAFDSNYNKNLPSTQIGRNRVSSGDSHTGASFTTPRSSLDVSRRLPLSMSRPSLLSIPSSLPPRRFRFVPTAPPPHR